MRGLKLIGIATNKTIARQKARAKGKKSPFHAQKFQAANRLAVDYTYFLDSPGENPISRADIEALIPKVLTAHAMLQKEQGDIHDHGVAMTGWLDLPDRIDSQHLMEIKTLTAELGREIDAFVSLGIGGSYLGIEATVRALTHHYYNQLSRKARGGPQVYFLGQNTDPDYFRDTLDMLKAKRVAINVISKSGATVETAIAFRIMQQLLEKNWGTRVKDLIWVTTDRNKGLLKKLSQDKGYRTFEVPENVGGRFSVLTDVGLVGLAMTGIDIAEFAAGFQQMRKSTLSDDFWQNPALLHAALRYAAWLKGKKIEVVATHATALYGVAKWMEQLFPESEGHAGHGLWVAPGLYSEKLHANGQMVQQGERNLIETFLRLRESDNRMAIPLDRDDDDCLNYLPEKHIDLNRINQEVIDGPAYAHYQGGVPNMTIEIPRRNAYNLGQFYYLMEKSVAVSGYLFGHNPFIQPGVEDYKTAMFALLGRPGYEEKAERMKRELQQQPRMRFDI